MSELTVTAKVQVKVSAADEELLLRTMDTYRQACNYVAGHIFRTHDLKRASLNKALYRDLRAKFGLKSQMAQSVLKTVRRKPPWVQIPLSPPPLPRCSGPFPRWVPALSMSG